MNTHVLDKVVGLLLAAMSKNSENGLYHSFAFERRRNGFGSERTVVTLYFHRTKLIRAALYVRQSGPAYLRYLSLDVIQAMLREFAIRNYEHIVSDVFSARLDDSFEELVSTSAKTTLSAALSISNIFSPRSDLTVYPLVTVNVIDDFIAPSFVLIDPKSLAGPILPKDIDATLVSPLQFPPWIFGQGRFETPSSWLGVISPAVGASNKMKAAILGALALTPLPSYRYTFSLRKMFGGRCTFSQGGVATAFGDAHTPPIADDINITQGDHAWLSLLATKLTVRDRSVRRQVRALEYFYRAWSLDPPERFPFLCMTLDAAYGQKESATQAVIDGVRTTLGSHIPRERLTLLLDLRASVIHGGAPDVYDSRKYARYYNLYEADPIFDLELVVANCLRLSIFGDAMIEQPNPHADAIAAAQASGKLSKNLWRRTILEDKPPTSDP